MKKRRDDTGFTLVELSVVMVIVGLLTGGILFGRSLLRGAEIRSVIVDMQQYTTAVTSFRGKYMTLPGDMPNATSYWGVAGGDGSGRDMACYNVESLTVAPITRTCNGNGNGRLFLTDGDPAGSAPEWYRGWQHLANAGLVTGSFTGRTGSGTRNAVPGRNVPQAKIENIGYTLMSFDAGLNDSHWFGGTYDGFAVGRTDPTYESLAAAFKTEDVWSIDHKLDDGKPGTGIVRNYKSSAASCITTADPQTADYDLSQTGIVCRFFMAFKDPGSHAAGH